MAAEMATPSEDVAEGIFRKHSADLINYWNSNPGLYLCAANELYAKGMIPREMRSEAAAAQRTGSCLAAATTVAQHLKHKIHDNPTCFSAIASTLSVLEGAITDQMSTDFKRVSTAMQEVFHPSSKSPSVQDKEINEGLLFIFV